MADLRLAGTELPKELRDRASLDSSTQQRVEILRAGGDVYEFRTACMDLSSALKPEGNYLQGYTIFVLVFLM